MAYVNVAEWTPEHVAEWLRGLEDSVLPYVHFFLNNNVDGHHLLNLSPDDLNSLHILKIGHQELILEAVDLLKQLHYGLTSETLQFLALKLGCKARSLYSDLKLNGPQDTHENIKQEPVSTDTLSAVSEILVSVKSLISWLDRYPFAFQEQYVKIRKSVLKLSIELASTAQRDQFAEKPHLLIKNCSLCLAELCDKLVQDFNDSLIIQPASLDITTIKKKPDEELGIHIQSTYSGIHIVGGIKPQSPTTRCAKVEEGDEIVQVNYQTVIGWQLKKLVYAMREHPSEIHLTLKKRPRHTNILGQVIILRPYRIPSKKTAFGKMHKWSEGNSSLHIEEVYSTSNESENSRENMNDDDDDDDDSAFLPENSLPTCPAQTVSERLHFRMLPGVSHAKVQRRATVSGASPTVTKAPVSIEDLVNGVPSVKRKENISRSVSHDPSNIRDATREITICKELDIKPSDSEEFQKKLMPEDKYETDNVLKCQEQELSSKVLPSVGLQFSDAPSSIANTLKRRSPVQTSDMLAAHEEDYVILENKSLEAIKANSVSRHATSFCGKSLHEKKISEHESCGSNSFANRNPPSHLPGGLVDSVCEKTADSHITFNETTFSQFHNANTFYTGRATDSSSLLQVSTASNTSSFPSDMNSYQVVVVGGVPQKYISAVKSEKRHDCHGFQQKGKSSRTSKYGNRRISCKDLGMGDCQGWLYKQKDKSGFFSSVSQWTKRWIVLKNHHLYCYKDPEDSRAECLIFLPGATVSPAAECKTRKYCFKVHHQSAVFYFATETQSDLSKWLNKMGLAAIAYDASSDITTSGFLKPETALDHFYSETEDSDDTTKDIKATWCPSSREMSSSPSSSSEQASHHHKKKCSMERVQKAKAKQYKLLKSEKAPHSNLHCESTPLKEWNRRASSQSHGYSNHSRLYGQSMLAEHAAELCLNKYDVKSHKMSYNRSFSCMEAKCHTGHDKIHLDPKFSFGNTNSDVTCHTNSCANSNQEIQNSTPWLQSDEEYDILTASLGRQKPVAKEISPGLVARMAVSYSNLSNQNVVLSNTSAKSVAFRNTHSPGYVAKISGSFDHWAKKHNSEIPKCHKLTKSESASHYTSTAGKSNSHNYQRSASESHVSQTIHSSSHKLSSEGPVCGNNDSFPKRQVSMLDREYYRLYGRKKVSQASLKAGSISDLQHKSNSSPDRGMKFFPDVESLHEMLKDQVNSHAISCTTDESKEFLTDNKNNPALYLSDKAQCDSLQALGSVSKPGINANAQPNSQSSRKLASVPTQKSDVQSIFVHNVRSDLSKGIENVGFCSPDQLKLDDTSVKNTCSNTHVPESSNIGNCLKQSASYFGETSEMYSSDDVIPVMSLKCTTMDQSSARLNSSFKLFGSPKFMKKLNSPKLDKKNIFKSKKQGKEAKKLEQKDIVNVQNERKFLGSPRLARAIFGSPKTHKQNIITVSSAVQTDSLPENLCQSDELKPMLCNRSDTSDTSSKHDNSGDISFNDHSVNETIKSSSNSSLNSDASSSILSASTTSSHYYVETRIKPQITISLPYVTDRTEERALSPEIPRTPMKPTMGITMLGKRRLPSVSGESSVSVTSSKGSHDDASSEQVSLCSEVRMEIGSNSAEDGIIQIFDALRQANLTVDGVDLRQRRCRPFMVSLENKRVSQLLLELRALQRTLKDKEAELEAIDELCKQEVINHEVLTDWIESHPNLFLESPI